MRVLRPADPLGPGRAGQNPVVVEPTEAASINLNPPGSSTTGLLGRRGVSSAAVGRDVRRTGSERRDGSNRGPRADLLGQRVRTAETA